MHPAQLWSSNFLTRRARAVVHAARRPASRPDVSCSAAQPSRQRAQRLRQPQRRIDREEALRRLQQEQAAVAEEEFSPELLLLDEEGPASTADRSRPPQAAVSTAAGGPVKQAEAAGLRLPRGERSDLPRARPAPAPAAPRVEAQGAQQQEAPGELHGQQQQLLQRQRQQQQEQQPQQAREVVEPDEVREPLSVLEEVSLGELAGGHTAPDSKSEALLEILNSGAEVEERIAQHRDKIDEEMLQLLAARIEVAAAMQQDDAVQGLQLLYRRLKAEVDRKVATPAMRLLDELLNILDPAEDAAGDYGEGDSGSLAGGPAAAAPGSGGGGGGAEVAVHAGVRAMVARQEGRRQRALARVQAAFGGGLPEDADVLSLAARLAQGGEQVAEGLFGEAVDPERFLQEVSQLLDRTDAQRQQAEKYLQQLGPGQEQQQAEIQAALEQRDHAVGLVREVLELVAAFRGRQKQQQIESRQ